jgi:hypothetical protein
LYTLAVLEVPFHSKEFCTVLVAQGSVAGVPKAERRKGGGMLVGEYLFSRVE